LSELLILKNLKATAIVVIRESKMNKGRLKTRIVAMPIPPNSKFVNCYVNKCKNT
jgi:hypothetical protein